MDNELLVKVSADLSNLKSDFQDFSVYWDKHNKDVAKGEKAYKDYGNSVIKSNEKISQKLKDNIKQLSDEGKAVKNLEKSFNELRSKNKDVFDNAKLEAFDKSLSSLSKNMSSLESLNLNIDDYDRLLQLLNSAEDDFETLSVLVNFFEDKMKSAAVAVSDSFDTIKEKINETKLNIQSTEDFIKNIDKQIKTTAPGQDQANLVSERNAAVQALKEEKVALADYESQLKKAREENVTMATQLRRVKDELVQLELAGDRGSDRWVELTEKAEKYNDAIASTNAELRRQASATEGLDNLIGAVNGVIGVYSAAEGAAALFGDENEDLEKTLIKLNGAIALLNGLQAVQTELSKKETVAGKALTIVKAQYAVATDASAKATTRLAAATKLIGIGLLVGALALIVTHWKDISKFIGLTSDETERLNEINKKSNEIAGDQVSKLDILIEKVKEGELSFNQKQKAVSEYNKEFGDTLGVVSSYTELERKLIEQGADYIRYLTLKAKAEAAYQLAVDKSKEALEKRNNTEVSLFNFIKGGFTPGLSGESLQTIDNFKQSQQLEQQSDAFIDEQKKLESEMEELANKLGISLVEVNQDVINEYQKMSDLMASIIKQQEAYRIEAIENTREKEKEILKKRLEEEKANYQKQIDDLKVSETRKAEIRAEFNKLYNEESGAAYEQLRKDIAEIDDKYNAELENVQFKALSAIDSILVSEAENDRKAIQERWDAIRDNIQEQIDKTNDEFQKQGLKNILDEVDTAENKELQSFDLNTNLDRIDREKEIADTVLAIQQQNIRDIIKNEKVKQLQLLNLEKNYLFQILQTYEDSFKNLEDKGLFNELVDTLSNSVDPDEIQSAADELRKAFGEDVANEILQTVEALKQVKKEVSDIGNTSDFQSVVDDIGAWTSSVESFGRQLADTLGLQGEAAEEFAQGVATAITTTYDSLLTIFQAEIDEHRNKINSFQESIDAVEDELEREKQLYEDGYANNYEARQQDLENLKEQKRQEEEELKKAQKRKALLAKAEFLIDTVSQLSNLITASTNIFKVATDILGPFGVPVAIAAIATMFGAFAIAKTKAFQAIGSGQNFRTGLKQGPVNLSGPTHERGGFGVYNSETGERVAEFEDKEKVYVLNNTQDRKYGRLMAAMIEEEKGGRKLKDNIFDIYSIPRIGSSTIKVIERVNSKYVEAEQSKKEASKTDDNMLKEFKDFKNAFKNEFEGYKKERDDQTEFWETSNFFFVKKGNVTKKYPKKNG
ncbi:hypothetical protein [Gaetbulibacter sp. PBL-D1]|uniref:hypothetical protein n=1 Tax=Gaetbulibacter sp. PBL-D1 TaxID=3422594 RepID=UPI003D2EE2B9